MTTLNTFSVQQPQDSFKFVLYDGPPKQTPPRLPTKKKAFFGDDDARGDKEELVHAAHSVEVDLTCLAEKEADYKISGSGRESDDLRSRWNRSHLIINSRIDGASDDETSNDGDRANDDNRSGVANRDDDWFLPLQEGSVSYEQNGYAGEVPFRTLKSPNDVYTAEYITSSIDDHQVHLMSDGGEEGECPSQRADPSAQNTTGDLARMLNRSEVIDLTDLGDESSDHDDLDEGHLRPPSPSRSSSVLQDARCSARPAATESPILSPSSGDIQAGDAVPHGEPLFVVDTGICSSDQSLQKAGTHAIQDSIVEPRQSQRSEPASDQDEYSPLRGVSDGGNNHYHNDDNGDDSHDQRMSSLRLVQKRKRDASVSSVGRKQHGRISSKRSKQRLTNAAHAPKQRSRYLSQCLPQSTSKVLARAYAEVQCSEDTGAESSSDGAGNDENTSHVNSKELQSTGDDTEYEVERILAIRLSRGNLKYRVQWVGYKADPRWYSASNFKNSPRKLREFHEANPTKPGPPKRLSHWERCYDEDRDADDFPDDDKPRRTVRGT